MINEKEMLERATRFTFFYGINPNDTVHVEKVFGCLSDYWVIRWAECRWSKSEQMFIDVPMPSNRTDEFISDTAYSLQAAYLIAYTRNLIDEHGENVKKLI